MSKRGEVEWKLAFLPALDVWPDAGVYQLWIQLRRAVRVRVGSLDLIRLSVGMYVYTGRASRALRARVRRHVNGGRRRHWHIDYLLAGEGVQIERVELASVDPNDECRVNGVTGQGAICAVPRFGASDCRSGCPAHLWRVG